MVFGIVYLHKNILNKEKNMAIPAMTKNEILDGEIIRQNGIKNVLEEFGFK